MIKSKSKPMMTAYLLKLLDYVTCSFIFHSTYHIISYKFIIDCYDYRGFSSVLFTDIHKSLDSALSIEGTQ